MNNTGIRKYFFLIVPLLFLVYSSPSALEYLFYFPDEKYYTDAVIQMMEKDDCFTPYQTDGAPRFKKPILTYWVLMGSYKMFGVSRISSRLFFWLAGALLVLVTYLMGKTISGNKKIALTAAFITAANPLVLMSACRSIPDILLVLFLTLSAWGFLEIMINEKPQKKFYWLAYLGAALAFETKGFPAAAFAGVSMLFLVLNPWKKVRFRNIFEPLSMSVSVIVALSWFVIMYVQHGSEYWSLFFADQVGERVSSKTVQVAKNTFLGVINLIAFLIPWIIMVFSKPKELKIYITQQNNKVKAVFGFILLWVVLVLLMSGAVFKFYDRYLLPVIPLVSVLLAWIFVQTKVSFKTTVLKIFIVLNVVVLALSVVFALFVIPNLVLIAGICFSLFVIGFYYANKYKTISGEIFIANAVALLYFNAFVLLFPLLTPNAGSQLVDNLNKIGISENSKVYVYGNIRTAASMRIYSENSFDIVSMDTVFALPQAKDDLVVVNKKEIDRLDLTNYEVFEGAQEWKRILADKFPTFLREAVVGLKENGTKYFIAKHKEE
ncbi:glycosyltransferase family 39 protein [Prolixibacteraceae bacterium Z1-6]|uniref:Glycosyltransferase family 39 protein n=1 Tax=Draconibacterium aestuarii TaxID=2998507 RepID=A0A9X3F565_9BACT|nr:glycosyltransferase family 39 protein [Prolixibacteraceae bacterium Z1-6]